MIAEDLPELVEREPHVRRGDPGPFSTVRAPMEVRPVKMKRQVDVPAEKCEYAQGEAHDETDEIKVGPGHRARFLPVAARALLVGFAIFSGKLFFGALF